MESMAIADGLQARFPEEILQRFSFQGQIGVGIRPGRVVEILAWLRDDQALQMNHLRSLCGVDNSRRKNGGLGRFEVVYNLYSIALRHEIRLRAQLTETDPSIDSVVSLWPGADWMERETYDLMGIRFNGHPDLRRVLLPEDWEGHPLRKEYPLRGRGEWVGITELQAKIKELDAHGFKPDEPLPGSGDAGTAKREGEC
jgi:NADH-quinone oxidoreductase subunit C